MTPAEYLRVEAFIQAGALTGPDNESGDDIRRRILTGLKAVDEFDHIEAAKRQPRETWDDWSKRTQAKLQAELDGK